MYDRMKGAEPLKYKDKDNEPKTLINHSSMDNGTRV
jgi:hypothetical protein